jgi:hypothetical protein
MKLKINILLNSVGNINLNSFFIWFERWKKQMKNGFGNLMLLEKRRICLISTGHSNDSVSNMFN